MKIVGFGDSFIMHSNNSNAYLNIVANELNAEVEFKGYAGTGPWDTFFQFKDYTKELDVAVFCWSEFARLYHPHVRGICPGSARSVREFDHCNSEIWNSARNYYDHLFDNRKTDYEAEAFYQWFDNWSRRFSGIKFIHMWSFAKPKHGGDFYIEHSRDMRDLDYYHKFQHGAEIRPALMHHSVRGDWPEDISKDTRVNHLNFDFHRYLSTFIIDAIIDYVPGKIYQPLSNLNDC
jgi:hypothetical protein